MKLWNTSGSGAYVVLYNPQSEVYIFTGEKGLIIDNQYFVPVRDL